MSTPKYATVVVKPRLVLYHASIGTAGRTEDWRAAIRILGAGFNAASFLIYNKDVSSMIMSTGFAVAIATYAIGLYVTV